MLGGAITIFYFILRATAEIDNRLRQSIFLVFLACIYSQLLCALGFCFRGIKRWIIRLTRAQIVMLHSTGIDGHDLGEPVRLDSL
ncbi:hypothetical protein K469DRAFT_720716 [Zopfia rhizophila CBS 207.26]|uniref:Uncharacterized protein n=1 Tax=Zopfia rhizophila CBS 207.26 TaxID=1314779 RepID=A0A6A6DII4_9PEZI|nr:hypothetical protein K469DRAFT_720716 [Zopfia rhizophila CBS 207.26]